MKYLSSRAERGRSSGMLHVCFCHCCYCLPYLVAFYDATLRVNICTWHVRHPQDAEQGIPQNEVGRVGSLFYAKSVEKIQKYCTILGKKLQKIFLRFQLPLFLKRRYLNVRFFSGSCFSLKRSSFFHSLWRRLLSFAFALSVNLSR